MKSLKNVSGPDPGTFPSSAKHCGVKACDHCTSMSLAQIVFRNSCWSSTQPGYSLYYF